MMANYKNKSMRAFAGVLPLVALFAAAAVAADPEVSYDIVDGQAQTTFEVASSNGLTTAISRINAWTASRTVEVDGLQYADSGMFTISLEHLESVLTNLAELAFSKAGTQTTILGYGNTMYFKGQTYGYNGFTCKNGAVLSLGKEGDGVASALEITRPGRTIMAGVLSLEPNGTIHMYDGVVIRDCATAPTYPGGGVTVNGGYFHMHGGEIRNCGTYKGSASIGGGVAVFSGGRFIMDDGTISGCFSQGEGIEQYFQYGYTWYLPFTAGGGVLVCENSSFIMNGGVIENCRANYDPDFVAVYNMTGTGDYGSGGGVVVLGSPTDANNEDFGWLNSAFVMNGGAIRNCSASYRGGGVAVCGYAGTAFFWMGGSISAPATSMNQYLAPPDGATPEEARAIRRAYAPAPGLWINGGTIEGCAADMGGGISVVGVKPDTSVFISHATIAGCTANQGGGIHIDGMPDDMAENLPDGVDYDVWTTVALNDVTVADCVATNEAGGVFYASDTQLALFGTVSIQDNTLAGGEDSNLHCLGNAHPFFVTGSLEGSDIGLTDPLLAANLPDADTLLSGGYKANCASAAPASLFKSDHAGWVVDYDESGNEVRLVPASADPESGVEIVVRQRDDSEEPIILPDAWLEVLGLDHPGVTPEEIADAEDTLNTVQDNGCRYWENIVLGNAETNFLVATVPTNTADGIGFAMPATDPSNSADFGYDVCYELRRDDGEQTVLQREAVCTDLGLAFEPGDPTGLYRVWALVIPTNGAVTNAIPSTNVIGVLRVESALTNTVTAVPWQALASAPQDAADIAAGAVVHPLNLSEGDRILAFDTAAGVYRIWMMDADGSWTPLSVVTMVDGVSVTPAADDWSFAPGTGIWISRAAPREGASAKPYYLYGQMPAGAYAATVAGGTAAAPKSTLCANPTASAVGLGGVEFEGGIGADDTIVFNTASGASTVYSRNKANTAWGRSVKTVVNGRIHSTWTEDGVVAPGTGFWYVRRSAGALTVRWPGWAE